MEKIKIIKEEFVGFIRSYAIIGVAIGIVIGQAAAKVITTIVEGLIMPLVGIVLSGERWQEAVLHLGRADIKLGLIIAALLDFFTVSLVVFFLVRYILRVETPKK